MSNGLSDPARPSITGISPPFESHRHAIRLHRVWGNAMPPGCTIASYGRTKPTLTFSSMDSATQTQSTEPTLPLRDLASRHRGLTPAVADCYVEAARVCLDRHHSSPTRIEIRNGKTESAAVLDWDSTDDRTRTAWANETDATAFGAYACVIAAVELTNGLYAIRRAETLTGADYYVALAGQGMDDLEDCLRLEVSGTNRGLTAALEYRLRQKVQQTKDGASNLPALAGVVGFQALSILIEQVNVDDLG